jgi:hypothetical protein
VPDLTSEFGINIDKRLNEEEVIWLTTVAKYLPEMNITQEQLTATYSAEIRIKPTRVRGI